MRYGLPALCLATFAALAVPGPGRAALAAQEVRVLAGAGSITAATLSDVQRRATSLLPALASRFPRAGGAPITIFVHRSIASVPEDVRAGLDRGAAGVALLARGEIRLILDRMGFVRPDDLDTVLGHELVHLLLNQQVGAAAGPYVPRWFHEGLAQVLTGAPFLGSSEEDIVVLARTSHLLSFRRLSQAFPHGERALRVAYAQSFSWVSYLEREFGLAVLLEVASGCRADVDFDTSFRQVTGQPLIYVEKDWVDYVAEGSGAAYRLLLGSCFSLALVAALPLLALAGARRWNRDHAVQERLAEEERREEEARLTADAEPRVDEPGDPAGEVTAGPEEASDHGDER